MSENTKRVCIRGNSSKGILPTLQRTICQIDDFAKILRPQGRKFVLPRSHLKEALSKGIQGHDTK